MSVGSKAADWADAATDWAQGALRRAESAFEPSLRLGVTGLSRAGKTVFITALATHLLRRGRLRGLSSVRDGRLVAAVLTPQPDLDAPRFELERHVAALYAPEPTWPEGTRAVSQLRISIRHRPAGPRGWFGDGVLHLDIVDYPGEWLLDLGLLDLSYAAWSARALDAAAARPAAAAFGAWVAEVDAAAPFEELTAQAGAAAYAAYLHAAKEAGLSGLTPGRFLLPGELAGAPALTFAPLPATNGRPPPDSLYAECARRFEGYKAKIAIPFFRTHFAKLDRQVVLVDALGALSAGAEAVQDMRAALTEILGAFRTGESSWLRRLLGPTLGGRRIDRLLLAVTKADHIHHSAHPALEDFVADLLARSADMAAFHGTEVRAMALAGVRATVEETIAASGGGAPLPAVRGRLLADGLEARAFPGEPPRTVAAAEALAETPDFNAPAFAPPVLEDRAGEGPPHLRLDAALEFLIGDRLA